jgi:deazaflavin-dependent oxidoreductase (nitroreductase family)
MRRPILVIGLLGGAVGAVAWWRRHPRVGAEYVNRVIDPWLMRSGVIQKSEGELALVEHVGRVSGTVRLTPVHPVGTADGYRIVVPLGAASQWARNVLAAGHCRLQVGGVVHDLDEPTLVSPTSVAGIPPILGHFMDWLGFRYLQLHRFAEHVGDLAASTSASEPDAGALAPPEAEAVESLLHVARTT